MLLCSGSSASSDKLEQRKINAIWQISCDGFQEADELEFSLPIYSQNAQYDEGNTVQYILVVASYRRLKMATVMFFYTYQ